MFMYTKKCLYHNFWQDFRFSQLIAYGEYFIFNLSTCLALKEGFVCCYTGMSILYKIFIEEADADIFVQIFVTVLCNIFNVKVVFVLEPELWWVWECVVSKRSREVQIKGVWP